MKQLEKHPQRWRLTFANEKEERYFRLGAYLGGRLTALIVASLATLFGPLNLLYYFLHDLFNRFWLWFRLRLLNLNIFEALPKVISKIYGNPLLTWRWILIG